MWRRAALCAVSCAVGLLVPMTYPAAPFRLPAARTAAVQAPDAAAVVQDEAYWVSTAQLTCDGDGNGAIAEARIGGAGKVSVHPYEANIGARALVAAGSRYLPMAAAYLRWYLRHVNRPDAHGVVGTVYDYDFDPVACRGTYQPDPDGTVPTYDSTDAYAATFLSLAAAYAAADPAGAAWLADAPVRADLDAVADAIGATLQPSGLTAATPTYPVAYLMDNVETQQGLRDYARLLATVLGDPDAAAARLAAADRMSAAIEAVLWRPGTAMYAVAAGDPDPSWSTWYPDALAQLWPVWAGLGPADRRAALWAEFQRHAPGWTTSTPAFGVVAPDHDPNAAAAFAAASVGDRAAVTAYLAGSQIHWAAAGRPPPWTVDDSGFRALAAAAVA